MSAKCRVELNSKNLTQLDLVETTVSLDAVTLRGILFSIRVTIPRQFYQVKINQKWAHAVSVSWNKSKISAEISSWKWEILLDNLHRIGSWNFFPKVEFMKNWMWVLCFKSDFFLIILKFLFSLSCRLIFSISKITLFSFT